MIFRGAEGHAFEDFSHLGQKSDYYKGRSGEPAKEESKCSIQNVYHHNLSVKIGKLIRKLKLQHLGIYIFSINYYYVQCFIQNQDHPSKSKLIHIQAKKKLVIKIGLVDRKDPYINL